MSKLIDTKRAYDSFKRLIDEEKRERRGDLNKLQKFEEALDVAFYLLGWAQFEYLVRTESKDVIENNARSKLVEKHAWSYLLENVKDFSVRKRLDLIFHERPDVSKQLNKDYTVRNDAAHNYKNIPKEAKDVSQWLQHLEDLVDHFED